MNIIFNESKIKKYELVSYRTFLNNRRYLDVMDRSADKDINHYYALIILEMEEGVMLDKISSQDTDVHFINGIFYPLLKRSVIFILDNGTEDIHIDCNYKEGYPLYFYDEAKDITLISYHGVEEYIGFYNKGTYKDKVVKEFKITNNANVKLKVTFGSSHNEIVERNIHLNMPNERVDITAFYYQEKMMNTIKFDLSGIERNLYDKLSWANTHYQNIFALALYSDDYDTVTKDEQIDENKKYYLLRKDKFVLRFYLTKEVKKIIIYLNGKKMDDELTLQCVDEVIGHDYKNHLKEHVDLVYCYQNIIQIDDDGTMTFEIIE